MTIDRDIEPSRPAPDRDAGRDRDPDRHGHRRESDARHPRRDFSDRVDGWCGMSPRSGSGAVGSDHAPIRRPSVRRPARDREAEQRGWIERQTAHGPKGGRFTVVVATPAGAARAAGLWATEGRASQRVFSGAVKTADMRHDVAVYRAACEAHARIEAAGGRVVRIRIDAELKGQVAGQAERARQVRGRVEAAAERRRAAAELDLPMARGQVLFPDAQIEYVDRGGRGAALQRRGRVGALRRRGHPREGGGGIPDVRGLGPRRVVRAAGARRRGQWRGSRPAWG